MLWKTHLRITHQAIDEIGLTLNTSERKSLDEGIIHPDRLKDYPHHYNVADRIESGIWAARINHLAEKTPDALFHIGKALHYLQDSFVSYPSHLQKHHEWEEWIDSSSLTRDVHGLILSTRMSERNRRRCLQMTALLSGDLQRAERIFAASRLNDAYKNNVDIKHWQVDLNLAYLATKAVLKSTLWNRTDDDIEKSLLASRIRNKQKMIQVEKEESQGIIYELERIQEKREKIASARGPFSSFRNFIMGLSIRHLESRTVRRWDSYEERNHLLEIIDSYKQETKVTLHSHMDWFITLVPTLTTDEVPASLLELSRTGVSPKQVEVIQEVRDSLDEEGFILGDRFIIRRNALESYFMEDSENS